MTANKMLDELVKRGHSVRVEYSPVSGWSWWAYHATYGEVYSSGLASFETAVLEMYNTATRPH